MSDAENLKPGDAESGANANAAPGANVVAPSSAAKAAAAELLPPAPIERVAELEGVTAMLPPESQFKAGPQPPFRLQWTRMIVGMLLGLGVALAVVLIFSPQLMHDLRETTVAVQLWRYIGAALACVAIYLFADSWLLTMIVRVIKPEAPYVRLMGLNMEAHLVGGATSFGGLEIPYQIWFLRDFDMTLSEATSVLVFKGIVRASSLAVVALAVFLPGIRSPLTPLQRLILLGVFIALGIGWAAGWWFLRRPAGGRLIPGAIQRRLQPVLEAMRLLRRAGWPLVLRVAIWQLVYWLAMFAIIPLIFAALGQRNLAAIPSIVIAQAVLQVLMVFSPLPGGAGVAEGGFLLLIGPEVPFGLRIVSVILWRALTWLLPVICGAIALGLRGGHSRRVGRQHVQ
jgi:uncharacterized membrane protein YbhN (UPF0104 family)